MGLFSFFFKKNESNEQSIHKETTAKQIIHPVPYEEQIKTFESLGYVYNAGVTKEMILRDVYEMTWEDDTEKHIEENPYSILYYTFGWRNPEIPKYNYSEQCIWFDLDFLEPNTQYKWFMERMGAISNEELHFTEIKITTDKNNWEWIEFKVNGIQKKWKLEKTGQIADHFIQRFSELPKELNTKGKYTYFDKGGQQFVIDYATEENQALFKAKTGLDREWLGEGNRFGESN